MTRILGVFFALCLFGLSPAKAADCWNNAAGTQTDCGAVTMYLVGTAATPVDATHGLPVTAVGAVSMIGITPTDRTITSASGASQQIMAANASRHSLIVQNTGNANCGVNPTGGSASIGGAGTLTLTPNGSYQPRIPTLSAVTVICTGGQPVYAEEN